MCVRGCLTKLPYRGSSPIGKRTPLGPYRRPMPQVLVGSQGGGGVFIGEGPLYVEKALSHSWQTDGWSRCVCGCVQGYLASDKLPIPLGPP